MKSNVKYNCSDTINVHLCTDLLGRAKAELEKLLRTKQRYLEGTTLADGADDTTQFSETTACSFVKAMLWRVLTGSATFLPCVRFSDSVTTALSIGGSNFFSSKAATMFVGEWLVKKSQAG